MRLSPTATLAVFLLFCVGLIALSGYLVISEKSDMADLCELKGGVMVEDTCVVKDSVIPLD